MVPIRKSGGGICVYRLRTKFSFRIGLVLMLLAGGCRSRGFGLPATSRSHPRVYMDPDAYAVYSAVLPQLWPWAELDARHLVIREETKAKLVCSIPGEAAPGPSVSQESNQDNTRPAQGAANRSDPGDTASALAQFNQVNRRRWLLARRLKISRHYTLISAAELRGIVHHEIGAWDLFFQHHGDSGGWIQFSAVGFNPNKTTAVVYAEYACGRQCGGGALYLLHKQGNQWVIGDAPPNSCTKKTVERQVTGF